MIGGRKMYEKDNVKHSQSISIAEYLNKRVEIRKNQEKQRKIEQETSSVLVLTELIV